MHEQRLRRYGDVNKVKLVRGQIFSLPSGNYIRPEMRQRVLNIIIEYKKNNEFVSPKKFFRYLVDMFGLVKGQRVTKYKKICLVVFYLGTRIRLSEIVSSYKQFNPKLEDFLRIWNHEMNEVYYLSGVVATIKSSAILRPNLINNSRFKEKCGYLSFPYWSAVIIKNL